MIYKVYYQETKTRNPKREDTLSLYLDAADLTAARSAVESHTSHNIELIEELSDKALAYEQQGANFSVTTPEALEAAASSEDK
ncbi:MAG: DNA-dependent RNA polymerase auxiliary subunit epsilon family protein [Lactobacillaceae bacterium]|jgi:DNA-dependent RNA polymerase auxiliary subunit epsilon|nr:DNA-dependent RNA polymerase auxiliary subunit epsilon family protein [Lactobacillaceae bacterium]